MCVCVNKILMSTRQNSILFVSIILLMYLGGEGMDGQNCGKHAEVIVHYQYSATISKVPDTEHYV